MHRFHLLRCFVALACLCLAASSQAATAERIEELAWDVEIGTVVAVKTVNGDIRVRRSSDDKLHVKAIKQATGAEREEVESAVERVKIKAEKGKGRLSIQADIPSDVKGGGLLSAIFGRDVTVTVYYDLQLPDGCDLETDSVNGDVDALGLNDDLKLNTVNGSIVIGDHAGAVNAETVNGAVTIDLAQPLAFGRFYVSTVNGAIDFSIPRGSRGGLRAETLNGSIRNDFGFRVSKKLVGSEMSGRLGEGESGGAEVQLETINGAIRVNRLGGDDVSEASGEQPSGSYRESDTYRD